MSDHFGDYFVRQHFPSLRWSVVSVDKYQAEAMRERGERLYTNPAQAHAVADSMNAKPQSEAATA